MTKLLRHKKLVFLLLYILSEVINNFMDSFQIWSLAMKKVYTNRWKLAKASFFPFLMLIGLCYLLGYAEILKGSDNTNLLPLRIIILVLMIIMILKIVVSTHRVILLQPNSVSAHKYFTWNSRDFNFILFTALINGGLFIIFNFISVIMQSMSGSRSADDFLLLHILLIILSIGLEIFLIYCYSRCLLVLPSIAVDRPITFDQAWNITSKEKLLIVGSLIVIPSLLVITINNLDSIPDFLSIEANGLVIFFKLFSFILNLFFLFCGVAALSITYDYYAKKYHETLEYEDKSLVR